MNRRKFIQKSTAAAIATSMLPKMSFEAWHKQPYKMGLQLFTIRDALAKDVLGTLKTVAALGFEDTETYGLDPLTGSYYGYKAADFKVMMDDLRLTTSSGHYDLGLYLSKPQAEMQRYVDQCIEGARALNQRYITWPWMPPELRTMATFKRLPEVLNRIGEQITQSGLGFAYHNHDFEFVDYNGETGYDMILKGTDPNLVKLQLDMYWVVHSSQKSITALIDQDPKRFVMWHIKDMDKVSRDYSELGNGSIDYHKVLSEASQEGLEYYFLEQGGNFARNSMQSIRDSANYFNRKLKKYL
jgi:sugar phosphate isomerase/epimerase